MAGKLKEAFGRLDELGRYLFLTATVQAAVFLVISFCFFIGHYQIPLGFALGSVVADLVFVCLERQTDGLLEAGNPRLKARALANYSIRGLLYLGGLLVPALLWYFGFYVIDAFAVGAAYLVPKVVLFFAFSGTLKKKG